MNPRSKTVDEAIRNTWAVLASHAAKRAAVHADCDRFADAVNAMDRVAQWLDKAGARATNWKYRAPD
jgi:hypothetical protein